MVGGGVTEDKGRKYEYAPIIFGLHPFPSLHIDNRSLYQFNSK